MNKGLILVHSCCIYMYNIHMYNVHVQRTCTLHVGVQLLWGTSNLFAAPAYMLGASTSPEAHVFATAAAQVKKGMGITHKLGGCGFGGLPLHTHTHTHTHIHTQTERERRERTMA